MSSLWFRLSLSSLLILAGCASAPPVVYPRNALVNEILRPRTGYKGLTNRACSKTDPKMGCVAYEVKDYLLDDLPTRKSLSDLVFVCNVAGKRYKVCPDKAGLCRKHCEGFIFKSCEEDFLPITGYQFLIDSATKCASQAVYNLWGMP